MIQQRKHICGYPIWVENGREHDHWITKFWDAPDGQQLTRCPGCGGRLVPWEIKVPRASSAEEEERLGSALVSLVEEVEVTLYALDPKQVLRWAELTEEARETLQAADIEVTAPPWASEQP